MNRHDPEVWWGLSSSHFWVLLPCALLYFVAAPRCAELAGDGILAKVAESNSKIRAVPYSGVRRYELRNYRFKKEALVTVRVMYKPDAGKVFTVTERSGSPKLLDIVEKLLSSEAEASWPTKAGDSEISPANYRACFRKEEVTAGRDCYVVDLLPRRKNKCLIKGTIWVDRTSFGVVRLEGAPAASISVWIGTPHITLEFDRLGGIWLPIRVESVSSGLLLGASELEIHYMDYLVDNLGPVVPEHVTASMQGTQQ